MWSIISQETPILRLLRQGRNCPVIVLRYNVTIDLKSFFNSFNRYFLKAYYVSSQYLSDKQLSPDLGSALDGQPQSHWWAMPNPQDFHCCPLRLGFLGWAWTQKRRDILCRLKCLWRFLFFLTNSHECYIHRHQMHITPKYVCVLHTQVCMLVWR